MSDTAMGYLALAGGGALLALAALAWTGRWRRWAGQITFGLNGMPLPLTLVPALGLILVAGGIAALDVTGSAPAAALVFLAAVPLIVLWLWAPSWFGPRWYRHEMGGGGKPDLDDPMTAIVVGKAGGARLPKPFAGQTALETWNATWIFGEETGPRPHALARAGTVAGKLGLYPDGVAFVPLEMEVAVRDGDALWFAIPWSHFDGARTVPSRSGPDGNKRPGPFFRSWFPRLVLESDERSFLLEVSGAKAKVEAISSKSEKTSQRT